MDTGMRDLEQIQEREPSAAPPKTAMLLMAGACGMLLLLGLANAIFSDADADPEESQVDPLAALSTMRTSKIEAHAAPKVEREKLTFPEVLHAAERPEVSAAVAAAEAELQALDTLHTQPPVPVAHPYHAPMPAHLFPAAVASGSDIDALQAAAPSDPLVRQALPQRSPTAAPAKSGSDGKFTIQVISYRTKDEADAFAETLRTRGHEAFVMTADIPNRGTYYRVRIGPFKSTAAAERYRRDFESQEAMNTFVVRKRN